MLGRVLLERRHGSLNFTDLSPGNLVADELPFELTEKIQSARPIDQFRVGYRVSCTGEEVGQAHLIAHICRNHDQRCVEETGHLPEEIAEQFLLAGLYVRSHTYRTSNFPSIPLSRWLGNGQRRLSQ